MELTKLGWAVRIALDSLAVLVILALAIILSSCNTVRSVKPDPALAQCNSVCFVPCVKPDGDTGIRWDGTPTDPAMFDRLADEVALPLGEKLRVCETRRKACEQCLKRLEDNGVIQL